MLENSQLRATIDPSTGCVRSLVEKSTLFETLAPASCGNEMQTFAEDTPDAWNIHAATLNHPVALHALDSIRIVENGPVRIRIAIERTWRRSHVTQEIVLGVDSPYLQFNNRIDWHERHTLLKAAFPLAGRSDVATYEIPFGTIERTTLRDNSWQKAQFEDAAIRWADLSDGEHGLSLLNDSKYGYDAAGNVLRLSLVRSPTSPDPEADQGIATFSYAAYPHAKSWKEAGSMRQGWVSTIHLLLFSNHCTEGKMLPLDH